jgi:hypothetical protein
MLCACGCGEELPPLTWRDKYLPKPRRFKYGHNIRKAWHIGMAAPNPSGLCQCGCGGQTKIARMNIKKLGWIKGEHIRFIEGHRGRNVVVKEYRQLMRAGKVVREHVIIAETALGKPLPAGAVVHHVDGNPHNNTRSNLVICQNQAYHLMLHRRARIVRAGGNPYADGVCSRCRQVKPRSDFYLRKDGRLDAYCGACMRIVNAATQQRIRERIAVTGNI